jgi:hypothetical protein
MVSLMLDPKLKNLCIISSFVGWSKVLVLLKNMTWSFYTYVSQMSWTFASFEKVKCTHYVDQDIFDQACSLDLFEQITNINELAKEFIKREFLIFR